MSRLLAICLALVPFLPNNVSDLPSDDGTLPRAAFGSAIAIAGTDVFVGEPSGFRYPGTVHVYRRSGSDPWQIVDAIRKPDGMVGDKFGSVLSADGELLVVGDPLGNDGNGSVYVYRKLEDGAWRLSETLHGKSGLPNKAKTRFGAAVATAQGQVFVGAPATGDNPGSVHVYRDNTSKLEYQGELESSATAGNDGAGNAFGSALSISGDVAIVGAPMANDRSGEVLVFRNQANSWKEIGRVARNSDEHSGMRFGSVVSSSVVSRSAASRSAASSSEAAGSAAWVFAGSPIASEARGMVSALFVDENTVTEMLLPLPEMDEKGNFGSAIAAAGTDLFVSAQQDRNGAGSIFYYDLRDKANMKPLALPTGEADSRTRMGSALAVSDEVLVIGAVGDAYGEGSVFFMDGGEGLTAKPTKVFADVNPFPRIEGEQVDCADGDAAGYNCSDVDLVSFIPNVEMGINRGVRLNDVWGWTDPLNGKEYALIGHMEGTEFIDVSNPNNPVHLGSLERTAGARANTWRDIKTYKDHAFIVADGAGDHGIQIFDLKLLRSVTNPPVQFSPTALYKDVHSAHNIVINEDTGFAYTVGGSSGGETCGGGLYMLDIRDPLNPSFAGCFADETTGRSNTGSSHDSQCVKYAGPDTQYSGREICFSANGTALSIADVTDKDNPKAISTGTYPDFGYVHQGWLSEDHAYFFQNDEGDETSGKVDKTRTLIWDVRDLDDPIMVREYFAVDGSTDHNLYVKGTLLYSTNNSAGLRILDISDPVNPVEVGYFDTTPHGANAAGFDGTWSSYPYFESGVIVVTSRREGVFFLKKKEQEF